VSIALKTVPEVLDRVQSDLVLTDDELAAVLGLSPAQLERVRSLSGRLPAVATQRLDQLASLNDRLHDSFEPEGVTLWLRSGSRYLGGRSLLSVLYEGRFDRANTALDAFDAGIFL
jgi:DNA-binding Xre family transcriptional regulator